MNPFGLVDESDDAPPLPPPACDVAGCPHHAWELYLPGGEGSYWLCDDHMRSHGWCPGCHDFWGGIESFDYSSSGYCEGCEFDVRLDEGEYEPDYWQNY